MIVDARFAGGHLEVEATTAAWDDNTNVVNITGPGFTLDMFPHEARAFAEALQEAADAAEKAQKRVRRSRAVDENLRRIDDE